MAERRYTITVLPSARRDLASLPVAAQRRIGRAVDALAIEPRPRGARLLTGGADRVWRVRVGAYRILYDIRDDQLVVLVIRVAHRRDAYRGR